MRRGEAVEHRALYTVKAVTEVCRAEKYASVSAGQVRGRIRTAFVEKAEDMDVSRVWSRTIEDKYSADQIFFQHLV